MPKIVLNASPEILHTLETAPEVLERPGVVSRTAEFKGMEMSVVRMFCQDCQAPFPTLFMVQDWLWRHLGLEGIICLDCFERRLGRPLAAQDFKEPKYNGFLFRSPPAPMPEPEWETFVQSVMEKRT